MPSSDLETLLGAAKHPKGMSKQSENIVHRLFARQICHHRPNTHIHQARTLYENIVPSHTIYDVECPDQNFRKFTNDGQYLICFSRNHQDVVVYRHKWLNFCTKGDSSDQLVDLPPKASKFDSHFSLLYSLPLASGTEIISKDFFLSTENGLYGVFATSTALNDNSSPATDGAVPGVPSTDKITIFLVSLAEGRITDQRSFHDDFIHLAHNMGVFLYDDLLAILSIRFQCIRILQIRATGRFVDVRTIGTHCREDDELVLNSQTQEEESYHKRQASLKKARGLSQHDVSVSGSKNAKQGKPWPPLWNMKPQSQGQSTRRERHRRQQTSASNNSAHLPRSENGGGDDDPSANGAPDANGNGGQTEIQEADLDLQYENYFRGLLATLEDTAVNEISTPGNDSRPNSAHVQGPLNARPPSQEAALSNCHNSGGGEQPPQQNGQFSASERGVRSRQNSGGGGAVGELLRTAYVPMDASAAAHAGRNHSEGSTSTSGGGHYSSAGPSRLGRSSYTSTTSGSSLDRHTSGRGSSSALYTSTTMSSSESESRSEGGSRRDVSFSGGNMGYGSNGRAAGNGSVIAQTENGSFVEYVVSSRTHGAAAVVQQVVASGEHASLQTSSSFREGASDRRSLGGGGLYLRENGDLGTSSTANGGHSHEANVDEPNADDRTLPSRPVERSTTSMTTANRAADVNQNETARLAHPAGRDGDNNNNGNVNRAVGRPGDGDNGGAVQRNRPGSDAAAGSNEGGGGGQVLGGIKQRLLSFIFQGVVNEDISPITKAQRLKRFYYHFQHYVDLVMWKVQFLDRYHLLIKFGSVDGVLQRNSDTSHQTAFLAIFNLETTEMLGFYQNSSEEFLLSFEQFCDHFRVAPRYPMYMNFISSYSNNSHVRDQLRKQRMACSSSKTGNYLQVVKRTLAWVPFNSQCQSPAAYFDQSLFHYDEKLISAIDRHKPCVEHPIKFISRRKPNCLKFKLSPGPEHGASDGRTKRVASFIFHPIFPFAISIQQSFLQPPIINFHFRK